VYLTVSLATPYQSVVRGFRITDRGAREAAIIVEGDENA
jgi:hypothetical protein